MPYEATLINNIRVRIYEIAYLGGIAIIMCTWSGIKRLSTISLSFWGCTLAENLSEMLVQLPVQRPASALRMNIP